MGTLTLGSDGVNLVGLWIAGQKYHRDTLPEQVEKRENLPIFRETERWLLRYFAGEQPAISELPLAPAGGTFRKKVWKLLCQIPYGEKTTYGKLAKQVAQRMGRPSMSSQAVGGAVGHNPISIIIPCHRVVGTNGSLTGYAGGLEIKQKLLALEGVDISALFRPKRGTAL